MSEISRDASWMVTASGAPMIDRVMGRSASSATSLVSMVSRSWRKSWKAATELRRFTAMLCRTLVSTLCLTIRRLVVVNPVVINSMERRKRVRSRSLGTNLPDSIGEEFRADSGDGFTGISERTCIPCRGPCGNAPGLMGLSPASGGASGCGCPRCEWRGSSGIPRPHSAIHRG
jgi:hypothetical protein